MDKPTVSRKNVFMITGEASGDLHGAHLVNAMKKKSSQIDFLAIGGKHLTEAGAKIVYPIEKLSVMGLTEVLFKLPEVFAGLRVVRKVIRILRPDLLILIDFPDFNFYAAKFAKRFNIPVLYYISPQLWAWRSGRIRKIKERVDHMAVILPFETTFYRRHRIPVTFVGHPLLDQESKADALAKRTITEDSNRIIGLLPGSREVEIERHLPIMIASAHKMAPQFDGAEFWVPVAPSLQARHLEQIIQRYQGPAKLRIIEEGVAPVFKKAFFLIAASGTVTLEAAMHGTPMIVIYRVSNTSYRLARAMIRVKHIGLINLIAGREIVPELLQDEANPQAISQKALAMMHDPKRLREMREALLLVRDLLGKTGASSKTADVAIQLLRHPPPSTSENTQKRPS